MDNPAPRLQHANVSRGVGGGRPAAIHSTATIVGMDAATPDTGEWLAAIVRGLRLGREIADIEVRRRLREVANPRVHGETGAVTPLRLEEERGVLQRLPAPYRGAVRSALPQRREAPGAQSPAMPPSPRHCSTGCCYTMPTSYRSRARAIDCAASAQPESFGAVMRNRLGPVGLTRRALKLHPQIRHPLPHSHKRAVLALVGVGRSTCSAMVLSSSRCSTRRNVPAWSIKISSSTLSRGPSACMRARAPASLPRR